MSLNPIPFGNDQYYQDYIRKLQEELEYYRSRDGKTYYGKNCPACGNPARELGALGVCQHCTPRAQRVLLELMRDPSTPTCKACARHLNACECPHSQAYRELKA